jgi:hypothetical protein
MKQQKLLEGDLLGEHEKMDQESISERNKGKLARSFSLRKVTDIIINSVPRSEAILTPWLRIRI